MALTLIQGAESVLADRAISEIVSKATGAVVTQIDANEIVVEILKKNIAKKIFVTHLCILI